MAMLQSLALILSSILAIKATAVLPQTPTSINVKDAYLALDNGSLGAGPDPRFSVVPSFNEGFLPPNATLVNVLYVLAGIADVDIKSNIQQQAWSDADFPQVEIITTSALKAVNLLFGIFAGIEYMVRYNRFYEVSLTLKWEKKTIGRIWIVLPGFDGLPSSNSTGNDARKSIDYSSVVGNLTDVDSNGSSTNLLNNTISLGTSIQMSIADIGGGRSLRRNQVFLTCYAALVHIAPSSNEAYMVDFTSKSPIGDVYINLLHWGPGIKNFRVIQAITYLPRLLLNSPRGFREVSFRVMEEDVMVLEGSLQRIAPPGRISISWMKAVLVACTTFS